MPIRHRPFFIIGKFEELSYNAAEILDKHTHKTESFQITPFLYDTH